MGGRGRRAWREGGGWAKWQSHHSWFWYYVLPLHIYLFFFNSYSCTHLYMHLVYIDMFSSPCILLLSPPFFLNRWVHWWGGASETQHKGGEWLRDAMQLDGGGGLPARPEEEAWGLLFEVSFYFLPLSFYMAFYYLLFFKFFLLPLHFSSSFRGWTCWRRWVLFKRRPID